MTTQALSREQLASLSEEVGPERSLLVMCSAFRGRDTGGFANLTLKKIPKTVLARCEWGQDDYSLQIKALPPAAEAGPEAPPPRNNTRAARKARATAGQSTLFE